MNKKKLFLGMVLVTLLSGAVLADTLYLTNGSTLQGNFLRLENGQIFFQLTTGGDRDRGRVLRFTLKEVLRIVTDRDPDGTLNEGRGGCRLLRPARDVRQQVPSDYSYVK